MSIQWIDISRNYPTMEPSKASLGVFASEPDRLRVVGGLPNGYTIRPETAKDRDRLVKWLNGLDYE